MVNTVNQTFQEFQKFGNSSELVILIHRYTSNRQRLDDIFHVVQEQIPAVFQNFFSTMQLILSIYLVITCQR